MTETKKASKRTVTDGSGKFSDEEVAAMQERAKELKAAKRGTAKGDPLADVLAKIAEMPDSDRAMAERFHAVVMATAPELTPRLWYGMPAYAKDGKLICFFQSADKFKARYATFGFEEHAKLDDGRMWPTSWALTKLTKDEEARIADLVKQAVG
jgi:uncharacterized protein YdhG (YjbR/CyaY superfamily)